MRRLRFDPAVQRETALELSGDSLRARIEQPAPAMWRLLVEPKDGPHKRPVAAAGAAALPIEATRRGDSHLLAGDGGRTLEVATAPLSLCWGRLQLVAGIDHGRLAISWPEGDGRRYAGLGERAAPLPLPRRRYQNWTTDCGSYLPGEDPLYQAHPFLFCLERDGSAWGLLLDEAWRTDFRLGKEEARSRARTDGPTLDVYLIDGPTPEALLSRLTALTGRAPMPPRWALGYHQCRWGYKDREKVREIARGHREHDLPLDAIWLDIDYMDRYRVFTFDPERFPDPATLCAELAKEGIRTVVIVDPGVSASEGYPVWEQGRERDLFIRGSAGPYLGACWPERCAWPDFSRAEVRAWWGEQHKSYLEAGVAGIWNDMNEPANLEGGRIGTLPGDAIQGGGSHAELHNLYGLQMSRATREGLERLAPDRRPFVLTRSGFCGIQRHAWVWTGDNWSTFESMALSIPMLLHLGLSGVPFAGADVGGFAGDCSGELLARWSWLGALYPLFRNHSAWDTRDQEPWRFSAPILSAVREALRFRYRLLPYLYTLAREATETGLPLLRPLLFADPADPEAASCDDQLLVGDALLAAPALRRGQRSRPVYLPTGRWQDFWTGRWHAGPGTISVDTPLDRIPLFQRAGTAVPLAAAPAPTEEAMWRRLCWRVAPAPEIEGRLYEDRGDGPVDGWQSRLSGAAGGATIRLRLDDRAGDARTLAVAEIWLEPGKTPRAFQLPRAAELEIDLL